MSPARPAPTNSDYNERCSVPVDPEVWSRALGEMSYLAREYGRDADERTWVTASFRTDGVVLAADLEGATDGLDQEDQPDEPLKVRRWIPYGGETSTPDRPFSLELRPTALQETLRSHQSEGSDWGVLDSSRAVTLSVRALADQEQDRRGQAGELVVRVERPARATAEQRSSPIRTFSSRPELEAMTFPEADEGIEKLRGEQLFEMAGLDGGGPMSLAPRTPASVEVATEWGLARMQVEQEEPSLDLFGDPTQEAGEETRSLEGEVVVTPRFATALSLSQQAAIEVAKERTRARNRAHNRIVRIAGLRAALTAAGNRPDGPRLELEDHLGSPVPDGDLTADDVRDLVSERASLRSLTQDVVAQVQEGELDEWWEQFVEHLQRSSLSKDVVRTLRRTGLGRPHPTDVELSVPSEQRSDDLEEVARQLRGQMWALEGAMPAVQAGLQQDGYGKMLITGPQLSRERFQEKTSSARKVHSSMPTWRGVVGAGDLDESLQRVVGLSAFQKKASEDEVLAVLRLLPVDDQEPHHLHQGPIDAALPDGESLTTWEPGTYYLEVDGEQQEFRLTRPDEHEGAREEPAGQLQLIGLSQSGEHLIARLPISGEQMRGLSEPRAVPVRADTARQFLSMVARRTGKVVLSIDSEGLSARDPAGRHEVVLPRLPSREISPPLRAAVRAARKLRTDEVDEPSHADIVDAAETMRARQGQKRQNKRRRARRRSATGR